MNQNDSNGTSIDDNNNDDLHATYTTETCTYYYYYYTNISSTKLDIVNDDSTTTTCSQNNSNVDVDTPRPIHDCIHELDVLVKYATTTIGRHLVIVNDNIDDTGIMLWPATHLLCQYLSMKLSLLFKQRQQHNSYCPSLVSIHDCINDKHNQCIMKQFFQYNYPIIHESNADVVFNDNKGTKSISSSSEYQHEIETRNNVQHSKEINEKVHVLQTNTVEQKHKQKQVCRILELGCGCGLVGIVFIKAIINTIALSSKCHDSCNTSTNDGNDDDTIGCDYLYVSTDMNCTALDLCYTNYQLNNISIQSSYNHTNETDHTSTINSSSSSCQQQQQQHNDEKIIDSSIDVHCNILATTTNKADSDSDSTGVSTTVWIRQLAWGDDNHIQNLQQNVHDWMINCSRSSQNKFSSAPASTSTYSVKSKLEVTERDNPFYSLSSSSSSVDYIFGADIVYPTTNGVVLDLLFQTVDQLLQRHCNQHNNVVVDEGLFMLSFCTRDGYKTPIRLLQAATKYNFALIQSISMKHRTIQQQQYFTKLLPLLDAQVLIFQRQYQNPNITKIINQQSIGHTTTCPIFPGLIQQQQKAVNDANYAMQVTVEDLFDELPFVYSDDDNEKDELFQE